MARFRPLGIVTLITVLTASHRIGKGGKGAGGKKGGGGGHKAAPTVRPAHPAAAKPNRVNRKPAPHHASQARKQAPLPGKPSVKSAGVAGLESAPEPSQHDPSLE